MKNRLTWIESPIRKKIRNIFPFRYIIRNKSPPPPSRSAPGHISRYMETCWRNTPILEKGDKQLIGNYRPISLIPLCGKSFGKKSLTVYKHLTIHQLITKNQSGFRPGDSSGFWVQETSRSPCSISRYLIRCGMTG